jgi:hypothetical protein
MENKHYSARWGLHYQSSLSTMENIKTPRGFSLAEENMAFIIRDGLGSFV